MPDIRPSPIAGRWYPGDAASLARMVDGYLDRAAQSEAAAPTGQIVGLLAPHAGIIYSGPVAAYAFHWLRGLAVDVVAILCPSHFHDDGPLLTSAHAAYETPLGTVPVDQPAVSQVRAALAEALHLPAELALAAIRHDREHAIEIELPFLQRVLAPGFRLLPLMFRDQTAPVARAAAEALAAALACPPPGSDAAPHALRLAGQADRRRSLVIASSDLSHYQPQPIALRLDQELLRQVEAFDPAAVLAAHEAGRGFACGVGALSGALWAARALGATTVRVVRHATSGDVSGDYDAVVGYAAAVFLQ